MEMIGMSRRVAVVLAGCAVCAAPLWADEAEQAFQLLYAKDLQRVRATADKADDAVLARQMVDAARSAAGQPGLITILCEQAYALASTHASAYETAIDAMNLLAETVPSKKKECLDRNLDVYQRRYAGAHGEARVEAGKELIGYLRGLADQAVASEDYAAAMGYLRRASYVAVAIRSGAKDDIQARLKQLTSVERTAKLIASLKDHLQADPKDTAVRERLIRLYVTEWDDPNSAARFLDAGCEHTLQTYVPMAARDVDSLADAACLELGDWYLSLADRASEAGKVVTLRRAALLRILPRQAQGRRSGRREAPDRAEEDRGPTGQALAVAGGRFRPPGPIGPAEDRRGSERVGAGGPAGQGRGRASMDDRNAPAPRESPCRRVRPRRAARCRRRRVGDRSHPDSPTPGNLCASSSGMRARSGTWPSRRTPRRWCRPARTRPSGSGVSTPAGCS